ncbi:pyrroline-5-carboxylate reductase [Kordiimonas marina]|uniref:pyrroline-5-carboxylate reductase n=1 Tax=Kordiimonas marina TaxID=2872312 RepID=UPI001FF2D044|nr:pyrroline-5-carboxylate reductase [Kordiimonas marina]MCJ9427553.1 pyrroline-5-carboxylate reductase [Kordiimonas marina]
MDILMVGCGQMGGAMLNSWAGLEDMSFTIVDPAELKLPVGVWHVQSPATLGSKQFDMVIAAVKPQMMADVMPAFVPRLKPDGCLVSIAAGYSLASLEAIFPDHGIIRVMPNLPALIGRAATGLYASERANVAQRDALEILMEAIGQYVWVQSEDQLDRLTAVSGSGPGYVFQFIESFIDGARELGFSDKDARTLVVQTMLGAAEMAANTEAPISSLRESVTSKGGTTQAGLNQLRDHQALDQLMTNTTAAAYARARELR